MIEQVCMSAFVSVFDALCVMESRQHRLSLAGCKQAQVRQMTGGHVILWAALNDTVSSPVGSYRLQPPSPFIITITQPES